MESAGISPQWITPSECLSLESRGRNVFVLPAFRGPIFQHLSDLKCKLVFCTHFICRICRLNLLHLHVTKIWFWVSTFQTVWASNSSAIFGQGYSSSKMVSSSLFRDDAWSVGVLHWRRQKWKGDRVTSWLLKLIESALDRKSALYTVDEWSVYDGSQHSNNARHRPRMRSQIGKISGLSKSSILSSLCSRGDGLLDALINWVKNIFYMRYFLESRWTSIARCFDGVGGRRLGRRQR